jgi:uncharacterized protein
MWNNPDAQVISNLLSRYRHIAVIGLSPKPERDSYRVSRYMQNHGYIITGVNPGHSSILGRPCHRTLLDIPAEEPIEIVNIFRRSSVVGRHIDEAITRGVACIWTQLGIVDAAAGKRALDRGIVVVMDRCIMIDHRMIPAA